jgi:hypothetical protein
MPTLLVDAFIECQGLVVLFIATHDWIPLGRLNNLDGIRRVDTKRRLLRVTVLSTLPFAIAFAASLHYRLRRFPDWPTWLVIWLWMSYGLGVYGMLRAWWLPYLFGTDPARRARYQVRFADTHAFLPVRHGIRPDTLHVCLHAVLLLLVALLVVLTFAG